MLSDYQTLVTDLVRDDAGKIVTAERDRAIQLAVQRYSRDRERRKVEDVLTTAAHTLPLPTAWEADFSAMRSLEAPVGQVPPRLLNQERWAYYAAPGGITIMLVDAMAVGSTVRCTFSITHVVSSSVDSIPVGHREPVACWAAAVLCEQLAAFYSGGTDSTIQADSVEQRPKAQEYSARARALRNRYLNELGIDERRSAPAGAVVNLNLPDSRGGDRLTHGNAHR